MGNEVQIGHYIGMQKYSPELERIRQMLSHNRRGLSITEISRKIGINRNSVAKYLDVLQVAGEVEVKKVCTAKLYFLSDRIPLSEMLSLTSDAILVIHASGVINFANSRFLEIEGRKLNEVAGKNISDLSFSLVDEEVAEKVSSPTPGETFEKEISVKAEDGTRVYKGKCIGTVLPDGGSASTLIFEDITKKRECQSRLRMKEALYRAVVEDQTEFIIRYRSDRSITFVNDAYCRAFGIDRMEILGTVFTPSIPPEYQQIVAAQLSGLTPEEPVVIFANPVIMPNGEEAWHHWTNRGIFDESGTLVGYQSVGRDITEQVRIQRIKDELLEKFTLLSDFSSGLVMLSEDDDISVYVAGVIRDVVPSSLILFFSFQDEVYHFQEVVYGNSWRNTAVVDALKEAKGIMFRCPAETAQAISSASLHPFSGERAATFCDACADDAGAILDELVQQYDCMSMGIVAGTNLMGTCIVISENEENPRSLPLIETMINQAAVVLQDKSIMESMRLTEERYESLLDHSPSIIGIHVWGKMVYANPRLREFLNIPEDADLDGWDINEYIHPDCVGVVTERVRQVYSGKALPLVKERLLDMNGTTKEVMSICFPTVYRGKLGCEFIFQPL